MKKSSSPAGLVVTVACLAVAGFFFHKPLGRFFQQNVFQKAPGRDLLKETEMSLQSLEEADQRHTRGLRHMDDGLLDQAVGEFQKALELRKGHVPYYRSLASAYERKNEFKKALKTWNEIIKYDPDGAFSGEAKENIARLQVRE